MAVQVMIDADGSEVAAVVPWPAWLALADLARGMLPGLFADLTGGDDGAAGDGDVGRFDGRTLGSVGGTENGG